MRYGTPIPLHTKYFDGIEKEINRIFYEFIYRHLNYVLLSEVGAEIRNANSYLLDAIANGRVWYEDGLFRGQWNAKLSKELREIGATFNPASKTFSLPKDQLPIQIRMAQSHADDRFDSLKRSLIRSLDDMHVESIDNISAVPDKYMRTIEWMNDDWVKTVKAISIPPQLTDQQRGVLASEWGYNLDKYIKNWASENIFDLREKIQANTFGGRRSSALIEYIQENYDVSKRKAKFLARQETSLLMSKFHETRYKDIGVREYKWSGTMDSRERPDHKDLQDQVFSWDLPPVVDRRTGRRANPGEDFGCRCVAIPIIK